MIRRIFFSASLGGIAYVTLHAIPYFPDGWITSFAIAMVVIGYWFLPLTVYLVIGAVSVSVAYHVYVLGIFLLLCVWLCNALLDEGTDFAETMVLAAGVPVAAGAHLFGMALPLEFLVVLLAPVLVVRTRIPVVVAIAAACGCLVGILGNEYVVGNLIIGKPVSQFLSVGRPPVRFYELGWLLSKANIAIFLALLKVVVNLGTFIIFHPLLLVQIMGWAVTSHLVGGAFERRHAEGTWWMGIAGVAAAVGILVALQVVVMIVAPPGVPVNSILFLILAASCGAVLVVGWEFTHWGKSGGPRRMAPRRPGAPQPPPPPPLPGPGSAPQIPVSRTELSLEDSLRIQAELREYIKKKFVRPGTALDIDVVNSAQLKSGQSSDVVTDTFTAYWKLIDRVVYGKGGRLLNRAGDGAIYIFGAPDKAVEVARIFLKELAIFNSKTNALKSPFEIRVGLHSGDIVEDPAARNKTDMFSEVLDHAGHLQKMAEPNQIVLSEETYQQLKQKRGCVPHKKSPQGNLPTYVLQ